MSEIHVPRVMGIINCTPDSFFAGSRSENVNTALNAALDMIRDGAFWISEENPRARVLPQSLPKSRFPGLFLLYVK